MYQRLRLIVQCKEKTHYRGAIMGIVSLFFQLTLILERTNHWLL